MLPVRIKFNPLAGSRQYLLSITRACCRKQDDQKTVEERHINPDRQVPKDPLAR